MLKSIDNERELYVLTCGEGYTCLGFDVMLGWANGVAKWLRDNKQPIKDIPLNLRGTAEGYSAYEAIMDAGSAFNVKTGKRCDVELIPELVGLEGKRVEVVDKYGETRRFYVGKSTGWMPCHLEIPKSNSTGGGSVTGAPFKSLRVIAKKARY